MSKLLEYMQNANHPADVYIEKASDDSSADDSSSSEGSGFLSGLRNFLEHPFQGSGTVIAPNYTPRPLDDSVYSDIPGTPVASGQFGELEDESVRDERMKDSADYMAANWPRLYGGFVAADEGLANVVGGIQNAVGGGNGILTNVQRAEEGMQDYRDQWNNTYGDSYFLNPNKFATDAGSVIGSSVPIMAFSGLMPGAAVAGGTRALTSALSRAGLGRLAMSKAGQALIADTVRSIPTSNLADSLSEYGTVVNDMMQNGVSEDEARRRAIPMFFKNMALDTFTVPLELGVMKGGKGIATGLLGRGAEEGIGKSLAKGAARTGMLAGASGLTEGYQEGAQNALENDVQGKRDGGWYNPFTWTNEDWEAARGGFVGGALMGVPGNVAAGFHPEARQAPLSAESQEQAQSIKDTLSHGKPDGMSNAAYNAYIELANSGNPDLIKQAASSLESFQKSQGNSSSESTDDAATEAYKDYEAYDQKQEIENFLNNNTVEQIGGEDNYNWLYGVLRNGTPEEVQKAYNDVIAAEKATAEQEAKNRPARSGGSVSPNTGNAMVNAVIQAANDSGVDPRLALAIAARESGGDDINAIHMPDPHDGIYGIMQAQDETVSELGLDSQYPDWKSDPYQNAMVGMAILKAKIDGENGDVWAGVRDYNGAGEEAEQYRQLVKNNYDNMGDIGGGGGGGSATYDGLQLTLPDSDEFTDQSGNVSGLTEDTRMKLRVLDNLCYQKFGQHLIVSSSYREGDPNNHGAGVAFDVSGGIVDDPDARQWLEQAGPAVGLFVIPEYQGEAGAEFAHGDNVHFSNVEPGIYGQTRNAEGHWSEEHAAPSIQSILKGGASSGVSGKVTGDNGQFERELDQAAQEANSDMDRIQAQSDQAMNEIMNDDSAEKTAQEAQEDAENAQKQAEESQQSTQDTVIPDVAQIIRDTSNNIDEINTLDGMFTKDGNGNDKFIDTPENRDYIKTNYKDEIDAAVKKAMQKTTAPKIKTQKKEDLPIVDGTSDVGPAARFMKSPHARLGNILADYDRNDPKFKGYMETFRHGTDEQQAQLADQLQQAQEQAKANSTTSNATVTTPSPANPSQQAVQAPKPAAQVNTPTPTQTAPKKAPKAQYEWGMRGYHWSGELNDKGKINIREADMSMYDSDMQFDVAKIQKAIAKAKTEEEARGIIRNIAKNTYGAHVERLRMKIGGNASVEEWRTKHKESPEIQEVYDDLTKGLTNLYEQATGKTLKEQFAEKAPTKAVEAPKEKPTTNNTETPKETPQKEKVEEKKGEVKHEENKGNNVNTKPQQAESKDTESAHAEEGPQSDVQEEISKFHNVLNDEKSTPKQVIDAYKSVVDKAIANANGSRKNAKMGDKIVTDEYQYLANSKRWDAFMNEDGGRNWHDVATINADAHKTLRTIIKTAGKETAPKAERPKETKPTEQPKEKAAGGFTADEIKMLTDRGFNRWTKKLSNGKVIDRLYIAPEYLGLELTRYKSGNISSAKFNGETISNSEARRIEGTKCYVDVATKEVVCDREDLKQAAQEVVDNVLSKEKPQVLAQAETKKAAQKDSVQEELTVKEAQNDADIRFGTVEEAEARGRIDIAADDVSELFDRIEGMDMPERLDMSDEKKQASIRKAGQQLTRSKEDLKAEIKDAFPTAKEIKDEGDRMTFTMPNGSHIVVDMKNEIVLTDKELAQAKKDHHIDDNGNVIVEGYAQLHGKDAYMALSQGSRENTGFHEAYHLAEGAVLTDREKAAIKKAIPDAEKRADKYAKWVEARKHGRGTAWGKLFQKIKDFAAKMKKIFTGTETVNNIFRQIESGRVWERNVREQGTKQSNQPLYQAKHIVSTFADKINLNRFVNAVLTHNEKSLIMHLGKVDADEAVAIKEATGYDVSNYEHVWRSNDVRHAQKRHGIDTETASDQIGLSPEEMVDALKVISAPDKIERGSINKEGPSIRYIKADNNGQLTIVEVVRSKRKTLDIKTMWKKRAEKLHGDYALQDTSETALDATSSTTENVAHNTDNVNGEKHYSIRKPKDAADEAQEKAEQAAEDTAVTMKDILAAARKILPIYTRSKIHYNSRATYRYDEHGRAGFVPSNYTLGDIGASIALHLDHVAQLKGANVELTNDVLDELEIEQRAAEKYKQEAPKAMTPVEARREGVKEFGRIYFQDPARAKEKYPKYYDIFEKTLDGMPEEKAAVEKILELEAQRAAQNPLLLATAGLSLADDRKKPKTVKERLNTAWARFYRTMVDETDPLRQITKCIEMELGKKLADEKDPHKRAVMCNSVAEGRASMLLFADNKAANLAYLNKIYKGAIRDKVTFEDVLNTLRKVRTEDIKKAAAKDVETYFGMYLVAQRTEEIVKTHKNYVRPEGYSHENCLRIIAEAPEAIRKAAQLYWKYNRNLVNIMEAEGLISEKQAAGLRKYEKYCPMYRDMSEHRTFDDELPTITAGRGFINQSSGIKKLKGGSILSVINPIDSMVSMTTALIARCERNDVAKVMVQSAEDHPGLGRIIVKDPSLFRADASKCAFTVMIAGKKTVYRTTPELYQALQEMSTNSAAFLTNVFGKFTDALRFGATNTPSFMVRNFIKDTLSASVNARYGKFVPIVDSIRGMKALKGDADFRAKFYGQGVPMDTYIRRDIRGAKQYKDKVQKSLKRYPLGIRQLMALSRSLVHKYNDVGEALEQGTRAGAMLNALKAGASDFEAGQEARDVTVNFSRHGSFGKKVNRYVPFFNASIQGTDKVIRTFLENPKRASLATCLYIILPTIILWAINHDDDWYKELDDNTKYTNWAVHIPGTDYHWLIPKPQEVGIGFGSGVEAVLNQMLNEDPHAMKAWARQFAEVVTPGIIMTALRPVLEWRYNYSEWTGRKLVPERLSKLPPEQQYTTATSELAKLMSQFAGKYVGLSPIAIDNFFSGWFGSLGRMSANALNKPIDAIRGSSRPPEPARYWYESPFIGSFARQDGQNSVYVERFYQLAEDMEMDYKRSDSYAKNKGKKGAPIPASLKAAQTCMKTMTKINKDIRSIKDDPKMDPETKRKRIDAAYTKMRTYAKKFVTQFDK